MEDGCRAAVAITPWRLRGHRICRHKPRPDARIGPCSLRFHGGTRRLGTIHQRRAMCFCWSRGVIGDRPFAGGAQRARHPCRSALPWINPADGGRPWRPPDQPRPWRSRPPADTPCSVRLRPWPPTRAGSTASPPRIRAVTGATRLDANSAASQAYLAYLAGQHGALEAAIEAALGRAVTPIFTYSAVLNGIALEMSAAEAGQVADARRRDRGRAGRRAPPGDR